MSDVKSMLESMTTLREEYAKQVRDIDKGTQYRQGPDWGPMVDVTDKIRKYAVERIASYDKMLEVLGEEPLQVDNGAPV